MGLYPGEGGVQSDKESGLLPSQEHIRNQSIGLSVASRFCHSLSPTP